ncbi:MAG: GNAT family N-acetyltransferase [Bryobacterales bacterium]|nr:GNAT family N-acetyltransferase [Bryobacterales bacterium]
MDDLVTLSVRHFVDAWHLMCGGEPQFARESQPGLELVFSGAPSPFLNVGFTTAGIASSSDLEALAGQAKSFAAERPVPWFFAVTNDLVSSDLDVDAVLAQAELIPVMKLTGMIADSVTPPTDVAAGLELKRAQEDAHCHAMMLVNGAAYGVDLASLGLGMSRGAFWEKHFAVLGTVAGAPASCSTVLLVDGHRYVALVATHPDYQRKGYASLAMRQSLALAAETLGPLPTTLHATEAGRPVYERMGYRAISSHSLYLETKFAHE